MEEGKYHHISHNAKVKKIKSGRFTITPVHPDGSLNNIGRFPTTSQIFIESGRFNIIKGPEQQKKAPKQQQKTSINHHYIPKGAKVTKIENGNLSITPLDPMGSLSGPVSKKSTVTYKINKFTIKKGPKVRKFHSVGGGKTRSSKRRSKRIKRYIV